MSKKFSIEIIGKSIESAVLIDDRIDSYHQLESTVNYCTKISESSQSVHVVDGAVSIGDLLSRYSSTPMEKFGEEVISESLDDDDSDLISLAQKSFTGIRRLIASYPFNIKINVTKSRESRKFFSKEKQLHNQSSFLDLTMLFSKEGSSSSYDGYSIHKIARSRDIATFIDYLPLLFESWNHSRELKIGSEVPVIFLQPSEWLLYRLKNSLKISRFESESMVNEKLADMGRSIYSEKLSVVDSSRDSERGVLNTFDICGDIRPSEDLTLIENGQVKSYIHPLLSKGQLERPTGNLYRDKQLRENVNYRSFRILASNHKISDYLREQPLAAVVLVSEGGNIHGMETMTFPIQLGFVYENGQCIGRLKNKSCSIAVSKYFKDSFLGTYKNDVIVGGVEAIAMRMILN